MMSPQHVCLDGLNREGEYGARLLCRNIPKNPNTRNKHPHGQPEGPKARGRADVVE